MDKMHDGRTRQHAQQTHDRLLARLLGIELSEIAHLGKVRGQTRLARAGGDTTERAEDARADHDGDLG